MDGRDDIAQLRSRFFPSFAALRAHLYVGFAQTMVESINSGCDSWGLVLGCLRSLSKRAASVSNDRANLGLIYPAAHVELGGPKYHWIP